MQNVVLFNLPVTLVGRLEGRNFFCSAANKTEKSKLWKWPQGMHAETMCFCFRKKKKPLKLSNGCSGACFAFRLNLIKEKYHCIAWRFNFKASQEVCLFLFFFFCLLNPDILCHGLGNVPHWQQSFPGCGQRTQTPLKRAQPICHQLHHLWARHERTDVRAFPGHSNLQVMQRRGIIRTFPVY